MVGPVSLDDVAGVVAAVVGPLGPGGRVTLYSAGTQADLVADVSGWVSSEIVATDSAGRYQALSPARVLDTRSGLGGRTPGSRQSIDVQVTGRGGVPATGVSAVMVNLTATAGTSATYVSAYPTGTITPSTSNLNVAPHQTIANTAIVAVGAGGRISLSNYAGTQPLVADVVGYVTDGTGTTGPAGTTGAVSIINPVRVMDTRTGLGGFSGPLGPAGTITLSPIVGQDSVTAHPSAVVLRLTGTAATMGTYLTASPGGEGPPVTSDLNLSAGATAGNLVVVRLGSDDTVQLRNYSGRVHVVVDLVGYVGS